MSSLPQGFSTRIDDRQVFSRKISENEYFEQSWKADTSRVRVEESIRTERRLKLNRFFRITIFVLIGILTVQIAFNFFIEPRLMINTIHIEVEEGMPLSNDTILKYAGLDGILLYFNVDVNDARAMLLRVPVVKDASVEKIFPNTLKIGLKRRRPLGIAFQETESGTIPLVFDEEGVIFDVGSNNFLEDLPVISGIKFPDLRPGIRLPETVLPFINDLYRLKEDSRVLFGLISELKFVKKNTKDYEVLMYPREYRTKVRIGSWINVSLMKNILLVLDVVQREQMASRLHELDFRSSKIVYRIREE